MSSTHHPPNIVLVTADSVRADHCGFLSDDHTLTPTLDRLADDGIVYETAIAPGPRTPSSIPPTFTGAVHPPTKRTATWAERYDHIRSHLRRRYTFPQRLQDRGYTTLGFTANPWTQNTGFDKGFDTFIELSESPATSDGARSRSVEAFDVLMTVDPLRERFNWDLKRTWFLQWPQFYREILDIVGETPEPYFLWVFLLDSHQPYIVPSEYRTEAGLPGMYYGALRQYLADFDEPLPGHVRRILERGYRDAIRSVDGFVARLRDDLDATLVFHSDHGEAFGEHGTYGHRHALYEENVHVPLLVHGSGNHENIGAPVSLRQLPTLITGLADGRMNGFDPWSITREYVYATTEYGTPRAVRSQRWKYIVEDESGMLFDLASDPVEQQDRSSDRRDLTRLMDHVLARYEQQVTEQRAITTATAEVEG